MVSFFELTILLIFAKSNISILISGGLGTGDGLLLVHNEPLCGPPLAGCHRHVNLEGENTFDEEHTWF